MNEKALEIFKTYTSLIEKETSIDEKEDPINEGDWFSQMYQVVEFEEANEDTNMEIPSRYMRVLKEKYPEISSLSPIQSEKGWWGIQFKL